ncbi:MAG: cob(I)yrinic acid a,c-diamide adenosyltransferase [bacterium]|nr:cob(I)yrinic acid a,c-diamide adenosyltransferase [bacterium]
MWMKLNTKRGDQGDTSLGNKRQVSKKDPRVAAYGDVDELNAVLGLALAACDRPPWNDRIRALQDRLFALGAELAAPDAEQPPARLRESDVIEMEHWIDEADAALTPLRNFVLPGGSEAACRLHLARTVCRRAERSAVLLADTEPVGPWTIPFLNRLSDLLFAWARLANQLDGAAEETWRPR